MNSQLSMISCHFAILAAVSASSSACWRFSCSILFSRRRVAWASALTRSFLSRSEGAADAEELELIMYVLRVGEEGAVLLFVCVPRFG